MDKNYIMKLSICIPTTELNYSNGDSMGVYMLNYLLKSIEMQTYTDYEIIISDHSPSSIIKDECENWSHLNLRYYKNDTGVGSAAKNLNFAISKANGEYIKTIFQDDYFFSETALEEMMETVGDSGWGAVGTFHVYENNVDNLVRPLSPNYDNPVNVLFGVNTISGPSVIFFKNDDNFFDEDLCWLNDVEFYYRLYKKYGHPLLLAKQMVVQRLRKEGVSNTLQASIKNEEKRYVFGLHDINDNSKDIKDYPTMYNRIKNL
jgi:glycosyltransferase involved in cell wall biosynthesis